MGALHCKLFAKKTIQSCRPKQASPCLQVYASDYSNDKLQLAAGWLYRATGNASYLNAAHRHWTDAGGWNGAEVSPYVSYDVVYGPAAVLLLG